MAETPVTSIRLAEIDRVALDAIQSKRPWLTSTTSLVRYALQQAAAADGMGKGQVEIEYSITTDEEGYTNEPEHEKYVPALVDKIEDEVLAYMAREYPGVDFSVRRVPERSSHNNRTRVHVTGDDDEQTIGAWAYSIVGELDEFVADEWVDWFEEVATE